MNIHEYQAKALLSEFGVPISKGVPVLKAADAEAAGFQPCKRCRPNEASLEAQHAAIIASACRRIEDAQKQLFEPFYQVLVLWLMIMFVCFGLVAPRNALSMSIILLCATSLSSVIFVILDLSRPYGGFFNIPSATMRAALDSMLSSAP